MSHDIIKASASILSANFLNLAHEINRVESAGIDSLHLDIMDNHMAPSVSFGPPVIKPIRAITNLPLDAHLMIDAPWLFFDAYLDCGVTDICFHIEAYNTNPGPHAAILTQSRTANTVDIDAIKRDINYLKSKGVSACITINPNTPLSVLTPILEDVDAILIMSVHPGFSGQSFIESTIEKIRTLRRSFSGDIKVDGGVNETNANTLIKAGATTLISASYLFASKDIKLAIDSLKNPRNTSSKSTLKSPH